MLDGGLGLQWLCRVIFGLGEVHGGSVLYLLHALVLDGLKLVRFCLFQLLLSLELFKTCRAGLIDID